MQNFFNQNQASDRTSLAHVDQSLRKAKDRYKKAITDHSIFKRTFNLRMLATEIISCSMLIYLVNLYLEENLTTQVLLKPLLDKHCLIFYKGASLGYKCHGLDYRIYATRCGDEYIDFCDTLNNADFHLLLATIILMSLFAMVIAHTAVFCSPVDNNLEKYINHDDLINLIKISNQFDLKITRESTIEEACKLLDKLSNNGKKEMDGVKIFKIR